MSYLWDKRVLGLSIILTNHVFLSIVLQPLIQTIPKKQSADSEPLYFSLFFLLACFTLVNKLTLQNIYMPVTTQIKSYEPRSSLFIFSIFFAFLKVGISNRLVTPYINKWRWKDWWDRFFVYKNIRPRI